MKSRAQQYGCHRSLFVLTLSVLSGIFWDINGSGVNGHPASLEDTRAVWWPQNRLQLPKEVEEDSDLNQILFSRANEKSDLERRIGLQRIAWALEHGNREEPNREGFKNHMVELGPRASAGGTKNWNGKRYLGAHVFLPKRSLEEAISEYGRVIKRSEDSTPQLGSPSTLLVSVPKTKYSEIKMPGDFRIMKKSY